MIVEWLSSLAQSIAIWLLTLFGTDAPPAWITFIPDALASFIMNASGLGAWIPWAFVFSVVAFVMSLLLLALGVKFVRWVIGWIPTMGGS